MITMDPYIIISINKKIKVMNIKVILTKIMEMKANIIK